jgi:glucose repression mediator protein
LNCVEDIKDP